MGENQDNQELQSLINQLVRNNTKDSIEELKNLSLEKDNSFIFLEKHTLHLFFEYITKQLSGHRHQNHPEAAMELPDLEELSFELDAIIADQQAAFEEIIKILEDNKGMDNNAQ